MSAHRCAHCTHMGSPFDEPKPFAAIQGHRRVCWWSQGLNESGWARGKTCRNQGLLGIWSVLEVPRPPLVARRNSLAHGSHETNSGWGKHATYEGCNAHNIERCQSLTVVGPQHQGKPQLGVHGLGNSSRRFTGLVLHAIQKVHWPSSACHVTQHRQNCTAGFAELGA